jgi:hypothetical protein
VGAAAHGPGGREEGAGGGCTRTGLGGGRRAVGRLPHGPRGREEEGAALLAANGREDLKNVPLGIYTPSTEVFVCRSSGIT